MVDNGFVGKTLGLGKNDYNKSGIFYAWFLAPKIKYCLVIDDFGVTSAKRSFKGYSEEHRMMNWMKIYHHQKEKWHQVDFQLIGLKHLKE